MGGWGQDEEAAVVAARGRTDENQKREGEESECLSVFSVYLSAQAVDGGD